MDYYKNKKLILVHAMTGLVRHHWFYVKLHNTAGYFKEPKCILVVGATVSKRSNIYRIEKCVTNHMKHAWCPPQHLHECGRHVEH